MPAKTVVSVLAGFFNQGTGTSVESAGGKHVPATQSGVPAKRALAVFQGEPKQLTADEKLELAKLVCEITGDTVKE